MVVKFSYVFIVCSMSKLRYDSRSYGFVTAPLKNGLRKTLLLNGGVVEWWSSWLVEWLNGGVVGCWSGWLVEWLNGGVIGWWSG